REPSTRLPERKDREALPARLGQPRYDRRAPEGRGDRAAAAHGGGQEVPRVDRRREDGDLPATGHAVQPHEIRPIPGRARCNVLIASPTSTTRKPSASAGGKSLSNTRRKPTTRSARNAPTAPWSASTASTSATLATRNGSTIARQSTAK